MTADVEVKAGDFVHVRMHVLHKAAQSTWKCGARHGNTILIQEEDIVHVEPRPIKVGDKVRAPALDAYDLFKVVHIDDEQCWIRGVRGTNYVMGLSDLHHAPQPGET